MEDKIEIDNSIGSFNSLDGNKPKDLSKTKNTKIKSVNNRKSSTNGSAVKSKKLTRGSSKYDGFYVTTAASDNHEVLYFEGDNQNKNIIKARNIKLKISILRDNISLVISKIIELDKKLEKYKDTKLYKSRIHNNNKNIEFNLISAEKTEEILKKLLLEYNSKALLALLNNEINSIETPEIKNYKYVCYEDGSVLELL